MWRVYLRRDVFIYLFAFATLQQIIMYFKLIVNSLIIYPKQYRSVWNVCRRDFRFLFFAYYIQAASSFPACDLCSLYTKWRGLSENEITPETRSASLRVNTRFYIALCLRHTRFSRLLYLAFFDRFWECDYNKLTVQRTVIKYIRFARCADSSRYRMPCGVIAHFL